MEFEILRLLWDYSKDSKLVDENYIEKLVDIVVNSKDIAAYVKNIMICSEEIKVNDKYVLAGYNDTYKTLRVYITNINQMLISYDKCRFFFNDLEQRFYSNLLITQVILHELEHANQKRILSCEHTLESRILKLCNNKVDFKIKDKLINSGYDEDVIMRFISKVEEKREENYKNNYDISPVERLAQIKSYQEIINMLSYIKKDVINLIKFEQLCQLHNALKGYHFESCFISSPTINYLKQNGISKGFCQFEWYDEDPLKCLELSKQNCSLAKRLALGLMIDKDEFDNCAVILEKLKKFNGNEYSYK